MERQRRPGAFRIRIYPSREQLRVPSGQSKKINVRQQVRVTNLATRQSATGVVVWAGGRTIRRLGFGSGTPRGRSQFLGGRTLKITSLMGPAIRTKAPAKPAKAGIAPSRVIADSDKPKAQPLAPKPTVASHDRKRGQRVLLRIRASIHVALQGNTTTLDAATLSVTPTARSW